jgi:hypothetical protein
MFGHIGNPDNPLKGDWDFQIQKIWEIESAGKDVIGEVQDIAAAADGRIYIADSKNIKIFIFSKDGKFISSFGNRGEGPGEIKKYGRGNQLFAVNNSIIFAEPGRIHYFSLEGNHKKTVLISSGLKPRAFISEDVFFSAPYAVADPGEKKAEIVLYNIKADSKKIISEFLPFEHAFKRRPIDKQRRMNLLIEAPNIIPELMFILGNNRVIYGMSDSYRLDIFDLNGKEKTSFGIEGRKRVNVPEKFKKDLEKALASIPQDMAKEIIDGIPAKITFFQDIKTDKNGLIYVFVSAPGETNVQDVDIFSPAGKYLYSSVIRIEDGLYIKPDFIYFEDGVLILVTGDEEGSLKVIKYSIKLPGRRTG